MKRLLIYTSLFFVIIPCLFSCGNLNAAIESTSIEEDSTEREQFIQDSIAHEQFIQDSVEQATVAAETIARLKSKFTEKKDEFNDVVWIKPNNAPRYTDRNGVYCYFAIKNGIAYNFRFRYQYYADDWLFIQNMIFNIDGENTTIYPDMETDCGNGGKIWEWCDESVSNSSNIDKYFILGIANAKSVKVKMNGRQYYDTRTLTEAQIKTIKDTYDYYLALGGKFE